MAVINNKLQVEMYPTVPDLLQVISAVLAFHPGQEEKVLEGIQTALNKRLDELKRGA